jgi:hypothetical protein
VVGTCCRTNPRCHGSTTTRTAPTGITAERQDIRVTRFSVRKRCRLPPVNARFASNRRVCVNQLSAVVNQSAFGIRESERRPTAEPLPGTPTAEPTTIVPRSLSHAHQQMGSLRKPEDVKRISEPGTSPSPGRNLKASIRVNAKRNKWAFPYGFVRMEIVWEPKKQCGFLTNGLSLKFEFTQAFDGVAIAFSRGVSLRATGPFPEIAPP